MKLLLLFFAVVSCVFSERFNETGTLNGAQTSNDMLLQNVVKLISFPYIENGTVSYVTNGSVACTATIISNRHLLTAAHCVWEYATIDNKEVRIEHTPQFLDLRPAEPQHDEFFNINNYALIPDEAAVHPLWNGHTSGYNDIAILTFPKGFNFGIQPVTLANDYIHFNEHIGMIAGYGKYQYEPKTPMPKIFESSSTLKDILVFIKYGCISKTGIDHQKHIICAGDTFYRVDHGDSGGPLFKNGNKTMYQVGILSDINYLDGTFDLDLSEWGVFTSVPIFCEWIHEVTEKEVRCYSMDEEPPKWIPPTTTPLPSTTSETPEPETSMPTTNAPSTKQTNEPSIIIVTTREPEKSGKEKYAHLSTMLPYDAESPPSSTPMVATIFASASFWLCLVLYIIS